MGSAGAEQHPLPARAAGDRDFGVPPRSACPSASSREDVVDRNFYLLQHQPDVLGLYREVFKQLLNSEKNNVLN